jgi:transcriptional regulator with XRE-family HTH domain
VTVFGTKLKNLRLGKALSLDKLALLTSSSKSYLWELENRDVPLPSGDKLNALAKALETTVDALMVDSIDPDSSDIKDKVFFRKFQKLEVTDKEKIRSIVEMWSKNS